MKLPVDQVIREQHFIEAHPEWCISSHDLGSRFIAETGDGNSAHVFAEHSLEKLLNRLEEIVGEAQ